MSDQKLRCPFWSRDFSGPQKLLLLDFMTKFKGLWKGEKGFGMVREFGINFLLISKHFHEGKINEASSLVSFYKLRPRKRLKIFLIKQRKW